MKAIIGVVFRTALEGTVTIAVSRAKLHPPELPLGFISRPHLLHKINESRNKKLTLLIAGAGYGKSTLLADWVQNEPLPIWINLDRPDRDPAAFFQLLLEGVRQNWPTFGPSIQISRNDSINPDWERLMLTLLNEIELSLETQSTGNQLLLVLDDYHRLETSSDVDSVVKLLLDRLPTAMHVVVASRTPLAFTARLESHGQVNKLTNAELRFQNEEIRELLVGFNTDTVPAQEFLRQTEGWVAGLQLLRHALEREDPLNLIFSPEGNPDPLNTVYAYLATEFVTHQSEPLQNFLLESSILNTFSPEDCDAILNRTDSARQLAFLTEQNLFTFHLQRNPDVYRYHHLLKDFLHQKLKQTYDASKIDELHLRAAKHYQQQQQWTEAFEQAMAIPDEQLGLQIVSQGSRPMLLAGKLNTVNDWFAQFSPRAHEQLPHLFALKGDVWFEQGQYEQALGAYHYTVQLAEQLNEEPPLMHAWHGIGAVKQRMGNHTEAYTAFAKALNYVDPENSRGRLKVLIGMANSYKTTNRNPKAAEAYQECIGLAVGLDPSLQAIIQHNLGITLQEMGEFDKALYWLETALATRRSIGFAPNTANSLNSIGLIYTMMGEFDKAASCLEEALALSKNADSPIWYAYALHSRGELALAQANFVEAEKYFRQSLARKETLQDIPGQAATLAQLSELYRRQGHYKQASENIERALIPGVAVVGLNYRLIAQTVQANLRLDQDAAEESQIILQEVIPRHEATTGNKFELTKAAWLLAKSQLTLQRSFLEPLRTAFNLAKEWNYQYLLQNLAQAQPELLAQAVAKQIEPTFVSEILGSLGKTAVSLLEDLLKDPDPNIQLQAVNSMSALKQEDIQAPLAAFIRREDGDSAAHLKARETLQKLSQKPLIPLSITTLGSFSVQRGETPIPKSAWKGRKSQTIFKYLLQHIGQRVHRETLIDLLWPSSEKTAEDLLSSFNTHISNLRKALEPSLPSHYNSSYLSFEPESETYQLILPEGSRIDAVLFETLIQQAEKAARSGNEQTMLDRYQEALGLYVGDYLLEQRYEDWCIKRREQLQRLALKGLQAIAHTQLQQGKAQEAVNAAQRLLTIEPWHEDGCVILIQAHMQLGQFVEARQACLTCQAQLKKELDISHSPVLSELWQQLNI